MKKEILLIYLEFISDFDRISFFFKNDAKVIDFKRSCLKKWFVFSNDILKISLDQWILFG